MISLKYHIEVSVHSVKTQYSYSKCTALLFTKSLSVENISYFVIREKKILLYSIIPLFLKDSIVIQPTVWKI